MEQPENQPPVKDAVKDEQESREGVRGYRVITPGGVVEHFTNLADARRFLEEYEEEQK